MIIADMVVEDSALLAGARPCAVVECAHPAMALCQLDQDRGPGLLIALCAHHADLALDGKWGANWDVPSNAPDEGDDPRNDPLVIAVLRRCEERVQKDAGHAAGLEEERR